MSEDNCEDCGEPLHSPLEKVGAPFSVSCSIGYADELGAIVMRHRESGEQRVLVEALEYQGDMGDREELAEWIMEIAAEGCRFAKVMLLPADARRFAAALLDFADVCDGRESGTGTDWDELTK